MDLSNPKYVIDSSPIIDMKHYFDGVFISFWEKFEDLINDGKIISSTEVYRELKKRDDEAKAIADKFKDIFLKPELDEQKYVAEILSNHKELIKFKNIAGGSPVADPFLIAQAICRNSYLLTSETFKLNAHNIPNICKEYGVKYMTLKDFFIEEDWKF